MFSPQHASFLKLTPPRPRPSELATPNAKRPSRGHGSKGDGGGGGGGDGGGGGSKGAPPPPLTPPDSARRPHFNSSSSAQQSPTTPTRQPRNRPGPAEEGGHPELDSCDLPQLDEAATSRAGSPSPQENQDSPTAPKGNKGNKKVTLKVVARVVKGEAEDTSEPNPFQADGPQVPPPLFRSLLGSRSPSPPSDNDSFGSSRSQHLARDYTPGVDVAITSDEPLVPEPQEVEEMAVDSEAACEPMEGIETSDPEVHVETTASANDDDHSGDDPMVGRALDSPQVSAPPSPAPHDSQETPQVPIEVEPVHQPATQPSDEEDPTWLENIFMESPNGARFKLLAGFECDCCLDKVRDVPPPQEGPIPEGEVSPASPTVCHFQVSDDGALSSCKPQLQVAKTSPQAVTDCRRCSFLHPYPSELTQLADSIIHRLCSGSGPFSATLIKDLKFLILAIAHPNCERHWSDLAGGHTPDDFNLVTEPDPDAHRWLRPSSLPEVLGLKIDSNRSQSSTTASSRSSLRYRPGSSQSVDRHLTMCVLDLEAPPSNLLDKHKTVKTPTDLGFAFGGQPVRGPLLTHEGPPSHTRPSAEMKLAHVRSGCVLFSGPVRCRCCRQRGAFCAHVVSNLFGTPEQRKSTRTGRPFTASLPCATCPTGASYSTCEHASGSSASARRLQFLTRLAAQVLVVAAYQTCPSADFRANLVDWVVLLRDFSSGHLAAHFRRSPNGHFLGLPPPPPGSPPLLQREVSLWPLAPWRSREYKFPSLEFFGPSITATLHESTTGLVLNENGQGPSRDSVARTLPSGQCPSHLRYPTDFVELFSSSELPPL